MSSFTKMGLPKHLFTSEQKLPFCMLNSMILEFDIYSAIEKSWNAWTSVPSTTSITQQKLLAGLLAILKTFIWFVHKENSEFNSYFYKIVHSICFQCLLFVFLCRCSNDINFVKGSPRLILVYWQISTVKFDCVIAITQFDHTLHYTCIAFKIANLFSENKNVTLVICPDWFWI